MFLPLHDQNPLKVIPFQIVTSAVILFCLGVFLYQQYLPSDQSQALVVSFGMLPAVLFDHRQLAPEFVVVPAEFTLLSSIFLHGGWLGLQVFSIVFAGDAATAWWAHIGGFVAGVVMIPFFKHASVPLFDRGTRH